MNNKKGQNAIQILAGQVGQRANPSPGGPAPVLRQHQQLLVDGDQTVNQYTLGNLFSRGHLLQEEGAEGDDQLGRDTCVHHDSMATHLGVHDCLPSSCTKSRANASLESVERAHTPAMSFS